MHLMAARSATKRRAFSLSERFWAWRGAIRFCPITQAADHSAEHEIDAASRARFLYAAAEETVVGKDRRQTSADLRIASTSARFAPAPTTTKRPVHMALPTRQSKPDPTPNGKPVVELPEPTEPPIGTVPEPLPPPVEHPEPAKPTTPEPEKASPWAEVDANSIYRPLAAVVMESEARRGGGEPLWQGAVVPTPLPQQTPWPDAVPAPSILMSPIEERPDISSPIIGGDNSWSDHWLRVAPPSLLWQPPLANPREPRMSAKALRIESENVFDAAVGGQFGLLRISPDRCPDEGFQLDLFAAVFSRFRDGDLSALDYRFGVPLTYATGCWQFKLAYEHTRNRIQGDVLTLSPDAANEFRREEAVVGVARRGEKSSVHTDRSG